MSVKSRPKIRPVFDVLLNSFDRGEVRDFLGIFVDSSARQNHKIYFELCCLFWTIDPILQCYQIKLGIEANGCNIPRLIFRYTLRFSWRTNWNLRLSTDDGNWFPAGAVCCSWRWWLIHIKYGCSCPTNLWRTCNITDMKKECNRVNVYCIDNRSQHSPMRGYGGSSFKEGAQSWYSPGSAS